jgi:hypothetical protein
VTSKGSRLDDGATVFRLGRKTSDGKMSDVDFTLSTADRAEVPPTLSVWDIALTSIDDADALTAHRYGQAGFLPVNGLRQLRPNPDDPIIDALDVLRAPLDCAEAGGAGHCGVTGLDQRDRRDANGRPLDAYRKSLRRKLADLANANKVQLFPAKPSN